MPLARGQLQVRNVSVVPYLFEWTPRLQLFSSQKDAASIRGRLHSLWGLVANCWRVHREKGSGFSCARPFLVNAGGVVGKDGGEIVLHRDVPWHPL